MIVIKAAHVHDIAHAVVSLPEVPVVRTVSRAFIRVGCCLQKASADEQHSIIGDIWRQSSRCVTALALF